MITSSYQFVLIIISDHHWLCKKLERKLPAHPSEPESERQDECAHPPESSYGKHSDEPEGKPQPNTTCTHIQQWGSHPLSLAGRQVPASPAGGLGPAKSKTQT